MSGFARWLGLASLLVASACGTAASPALGDAGSVGDGASPQRTPKTHRAQSLPCTAPRPAGGANPSPSPNSPCVHDADCATGPNGRCYGAEIGGPDPLANVCSYDQCTSDGDCGVNACDCRSPSAHGANVCFAGNCRVDADCGAGGFCSPSATTFDPSCLTGIEPGSVGFFCHAPGDECTDDADCAGPDAMACIFVVAKAHWACVAKRCTL
jgi:hypothetical protein